WSAARGRACGSSWAPRSDLSALGRAGQALHVVHDLEPLVEPGDAEDALDPLAPAHQHEAASLLARPCVGRDERTQATRVHELEPAQVDRDQWRPGGLDLLQGVLELRRGGDVELA